MTEQETSKIIQKLHNIYSHQDRFATGQDIISRITYWDIYFKEYPFSVVDKVVDSWIKSHRDMPTPSDLLPMCKDERASLQDIRFPEDIKPTWEIIYDAKHGEQPIKPEFEALVNNFVKWLRADPKMKEQWRRQHGGQEPPIPQDMLPYEI